MNFLKTGIQGDNDYYQRLEYFISAAQNDIKLIEGKGHYTMCRHLPL